MSKSFHSDRLPVEDRYVVSFRTTGLGDRIICLCAAWKFARNTGRTLLVDWRHSSYLPGPSNLFSSCFEVIDSVAGVPLIADDNLETAGLPRPIYPSIWELERLIASPWLVPSDIFTRERDDAVELIRSGADVPAPTVVFNACINDGITAFQDARLCLQALRPVKRIREAVDAYYDAHLRPGPCIGLHIRHGNGGDIMGHAPYWQSFRLAIERCRRAVEVARLRLGDSAPVFLCTDSQDVETEIRKLIPRVFCRPKTYRASGGGELHHGDAAAAGLDDALVDMMLLARLNALIRYPAGSFFSFYAAVMKATEDPHPTTVYDMQRPFDPDDAFSPAVLF